MSYCPHCGGLVGRDCYNVEECGYVSEMMRQDYERQQAEQSAQSFSDLLDLVRECQKVLSDLTNGDREFQKQQSSQHLWARCVELEAKCRSVLGPTTPTTGRE